MTSYNKIKQLLKSCTEVNCDLQIESSDDMNNVNPDSIRKEIYIGNTQGLQQATLIFNSNGDFIDFRVDCGCDDCKSDEDNADKNWGDNLYLPSVKPAVQKMLKEVKKSAKEQMDNYVDKTDEIFC